MDNKTQYIIDLSEYIYDNVSKISYGIKNIDSIYRFYSSFAMSKAENSKLTVKQAVEIQKKEIDTEDSHYVNEIKKQVHQLEEIKENYREYQNKLQDLHDKLEYFNIASTIKYVKNSNISDEIKKNGLCKEILLDIHFRLTTGLDELFYGKLNDYDPYFPGQFRKENNIKVWTKLVLDHKLIDLHLDEIIDLSKNITSLERVFLIHARLYYCHAFSNGNKRICRVLEEIYITNLWVEPSLSASHWYYLHQEKYIRQIYVNTIRKPHFHTWAEFGFASILLSAIYLLNNELSSIRVKTFKGFDIDILSGFKEWERFKTKDLEKIYMKKNKISERTFYLLLEKEKNILWDLIKEEKVGRNIYYSLNIQDGRYIDIRNKIQELGKQYEEYNYNYSEIGFLKNYNF